MVDDDAAGGEHGAEEATERPRVARRDDGLRGSGRQGRRVRARRPRKGAHLLVVEVRIGAKARREIKAVRLLGREAGGGIGRFRADTTLALLRGDVRLTPSSLANRAQVVASTRLGRLVLGAELCHPRAAIRVVTTGARQCVSTREPSTRIDPQALDRRSARAGRRIPGPLVRRFGFLPPLVTVDVVRVRGDDVRPGRHRHDVVCAPRHNARACIQVQAEAHEGARRTARRHPIRPIRGPPGLLHRRGTGCDEPQPFAGICATHPGDAPFPREHKTRPGRELTGKPAGV